jgi:hypothetical protein
LKRLALLWLACAAVGFAVTASAASIIALACDRARPPRVQPLAQPTARQDALRGRGAPKYGYTGQRLLGN